jgi:hypothetical protein
MSDFKSEVLPSGVLIRKIAGEENSFVLSDSNQALIVTGQDIARMSGIARPEKTHGCCQVINNSAPIGSVTNIDTNSGDIKL